MARGDGSILVLRERKKRKEKRKKQYMGGEAHEHSGDMS